MACFGIPTRPAVGFAGWFNPMKTLLSCFALTAFALGQSPDAFTGTWKLNVERSGFTSKDETLTGGTRTYAPAKNGTHVTWTTFDADHKKVTGGYTVQCKNGSCVSKEV